MTTGVTCLRGPHKTLGGAKPRIFMEVVAGAEALG
jgi:hypothetical protein